MLLLVAFFQIEHKSDAGRFVWRPHLLSLRRSAYSAVNPAKSGAISTGGNTNWPSRQLVITAESLAGSDDSGTRSDTIV